MGFQLGRRGVVTGALLAASGCGGSAGNEAVRSAADAYRAGTAQQHFETGLCFTHRALRRNVRRIVTLGEQGAPASDDALDFVVLVGHFLTGHHEGEDRFIFPALRQSSALRSSDVAFLDQKDAEHRAVHRLIAELGRGVAALRGAPRRSLGALLSAARELEATLDPHLASEEEAFSAENMTAMIDGDALRDAEARMLDHDKEGGATLLMLYVHSLTPDEQQILLGREPWFFRKVLVRGVWQGGFARFRPFAFSAEVAL